MKQKKQIALIMKVLSVRIARTMQHIMTGTNLLNTSLISSCICILCLLESVRPSYRSVGFLIYYGMLYTWAYCITGAGTISPSLS